MDNKLPKKKKKKKKKKITCTLSIYDQTGISYVKPARILSIVYVSKHIIDTVIRWTNNWLWCKCMCDLETLNFVLFIFRFQEYISNGGDYAT